jgi:hypothetical protein
VDEDVANSLESSATEDHAADSHEERLVDHRGSVEPAGGTEGQTATTSDNPVGLRCFTCYSYYWPDAASLGHTTF